MTSMNSSSSTVGNVAGTQVAVVRTSKVLASFLQLSLMVAGLAFIAGRTGLIDPSDDVMTSLRSAIPVLSASATAEVDASDEVGDSISSKLNPRMRSALRDVAQRYRVSADALVPIFEAVQDVGAARKIDPLLLVAVISIESRFNPYSESVVGAQGLMQIMPQYHRDKLPEGAGKLGFFDPVTNVQVGAQILQASIRSQGGLIAGLQQFGGAINDEDRVYSSKVLAEKQRIEQVLRRSKAS